MKNNGMKGITKRDEEALIYLNNITWCKIEESKGFKREKLKGFKLEFFFDKNNFLKTPY